MGVRSSISGLVAAVALMLLAGCAAGATGAAGADRAEGTSAATTSAGGGAGTGNDLAACESANTAWNAIAEVSASRSGDASTLAAVDEQRLALRDVAEGANGSAASALRVLASVLPEEPEKILVSFAADVYGEELRSATEACAAAGYTWV